MIKEILSGLVSPLTDAYVRNKEIKAATHTKKLEGIQNAEALQFQSDIERTKGLKDSWKDEFVLIVLSIPLVMCFIPGWDVYVTAGFESLDSTPNWFQYLFITVYSVSAGVPLTNKTVSTVRSIFGK